MVAKLQEVFDVNNFLECSRILNDTANKRCHFNINMEVTKWLKVQSTILLIELT